MTSDASPACTQAYVWIWLPEAVTPVVAGVLTRQGKRLAFNYGRSYLARRDAIPLYAPELPLRAGEIPLLPGLSMPGCLRDASPDAWGRRVLLHRKLGQAGADASNEDLDELTCLLESGSDRIGALDFQSSPNQYQPRQVRKATLEELLTAAERVEQGIPLSPELALPLQHGTSVGGARPKALIHDGERQCIAKFSTRQDLFNVVKAEFIAMRLAALAGLDVAPVRLVTALGKDVLLVERFDRVRQEGRWRRRAMVSALTLQELDEMLAAYASYEKLAELIRHRFAQPAQTLRELFGRMVFNILCGNTDDHARNHAAFWDGQRLTLTPAYDLCPQSRTGGEATQAMLIHGGVRISQIDACLAAAPNFLLSREEAMDIVNLLTDVIEGKWETVCDEAGLNTVERRYFWRRQFLNPFAFVGAPAGMRGPETNAG
ncbi:MAG: type II toxin-antitoxin system HipA family toxin [Betaproteobacteria bacterium]|nr:type II toxin-antitoxin system HipA family toxin [Betaproteobacteria bacterium]